ncbi:MAG: bifunctional demethylmenaquinone methyltransferase/2-methoxy-6-polyprenyl-1,4-benzoquinol methylase UbiE [Alphaproteobacteria bacterium]|nr:bifunctional demethylmenaquinone methyltransferase/2-methoxy-6-polyprenyl-1,4-benzoquinol methylase UbiE [Alphaproteobacteria bacterium]
MQNPERSWFGEKPVTPEEKTGLVRGVFDSVAGKYDLMNDLMSGGLHRLWKDRLVRQIRPRPSHACLDVAGGTGDIAFRIKRKAPGAAVTVFDLNEHMLSVGRDRAADKGWADKDFEWVTGNAESLPFPDRSFDVYTIAFGLRNVTHIDTALREAARVLRPGGRFFCLEFSRVDMPVLKQAYDFYSFNIIPRIGKKVANDEESYKYLVESIRKFPSQRKLARRMEEAGFSGIKYSGLSGGIVTIHEGFIA